MFVSVVTVATVVTTMFLVIGGLLTAARTTLGDYDTVRNVALCLAMTWPLLRRAWYPLSLVLWIGFAIQLGDTVVGALHHEVPETVGPLCFAVALFLAAYGLSRSTADGSASI
ncbi:hypothetical protein [Fodinicola feengrottensis]|uniref:hypothetical protein n=1 Tax=Fodinicola feengrottensis TaxID=435914 RepID=UPI0013D00858